MPLSSLPVGMVPSNLPDEAAAIVRLSHSNAQSTVSTTPEAQSGPMTRSKKRKASAMNDTPIISKRGRKRKDKNGETDGTRRRPTRRRRRNKDRDKNDVTPKMKDSEIQSEEEISPSRSASESVVSAFGNGDPIRPNGGLKKTMFSKKKTVFFVK